MPDIHSFEPIWPQWQLERQLGRGSFGEVWSAIRTDPYTGIAQHAAIKYIHIPGESLSVDLSGLSSASMQQIYRNQLKALMNEIMAMIRLRGTPNIVSYEEHRIIPRPDGMGYDVFLRMELLTPLPDAINRLQRPLTRDEVIRIGIDIGNALITMQQEGMIHRDIKPANVFVDRKGVFKLGDFGTARALDKGGAASTNTGTPNYMAPEVFAGNSRYDQTVDIYSLGIMLYRYANNNCPPLFDPEKPDLNNAMMRRLKGEPFPPPANADPALAAVIMKCAAHSPAQRYASAQQLVQDLRICAAGGRPSVMAQEDQTRQAAPVRSAQSAMEREIPHSAPVRPAQPPQERGIPHSAPVQPAKQAPAAPKTPSKKTAGRKMLLLPAAAVLLVIIVLGVFVLSPKQPQTAQAPTAVTTASAAVSAQQSELSATPAAASPTVQAAEPSAQAAASADVQESVFRYRALGDGTAEITGYTGPGGSIVIPGAIDGLQVSSIGNKAFAQNGTLASVTIPDGVKVIGGQAFDGCTALTGVTLSDSVIIIGDGAFSGCTALAELTLPAGVASIGSDAFSAGTAFTVTAGSYADLWCRNNGITCAYAGGTAAPVLTAAPTPEPTATATPEPTATPTPEPTTTATPEPTATPTPEPTATPTPIPVQTAYPANLVDSLKYEVLDDGTVMITGYTGKANDIVVPSQIGGRTVSAVGAYAFAESSYYYGRNVLGKSYDVDVPHKLTSIVLPGCIMSIGDWAFYDCGSLTSITIPNGVTSIGISAFDRCDKLTSITVPGSVTSIGDQAFAHCYSLTNVTILDGVTSIGDSAFLWCGNLVSVTIPDSVTSIGCTVFDRCHSLADKNGLFIYNGVLYACIQRKSSVRIPNSVTAISDYAFYGNPTLTSIVIPHSVTSIGNYAFYDCNRLTSITIPDSVTSIGDSAFSWCYGLTSITIPDSVTSIGDSAFFQCYGLTAISIPDSVTSIGNSAFSECDKLTSITIPDSVTNIGDSTFAGCNKLTSVTIKGSVTSIGNRAFDSCASLESINIPNSVMSIGDNAFYNCTRLTSITIPGGVMSIGAQAFRHCTRLKSVIISDSVTSIADDAFLYCNSLTTIIVTRGSYAEQWCKNHGYTNKITYK